MKAIEARTCFLWSLGLTYLWAFASLYYQVPGLYGDHGVLPVRSQLKCEGDLAECGLTGPSPSGLHFLRAWTGLSPSGCVELAALLGIVLSAAVLVFPTARGVVVFATLWFLYFSCFQVGQTFLWFQWDTLLLEAGFLGVLVAPALLRPSAPMPHDRIPLFLVKWLTFRYTFCFFAFLHTSHFQMMFASGVVKLTSECPTWWGLTALHYHFESQCIPTSLAWFAHQSPDWFKKLSVALTYVVEIGLPPLFLLPIKHLRKMACYAQLLFMLSIVTTGNYNFFNFLYAVICLPLLLDSSEDTNFGSDMIKRRVPAIHLVVKCLVIGGVYATLCYWTRNLFNIRLPADGSFAILSDIAFSKPDFYSALAWAVPFFIGVGSLCLTSEILAAFIRCFTDVRGRLRRLQALFCTALMSSIAIAAFTISLVPFSHLDRAAQNSLFPEVTEMHAAADRYQLTHGYGLFRSMTGVGGRPEVVLEGADSEAGPWREIQFLYKPGQVDRAPPFIVPHQPRLDWQMWFAALGDYRRNPWLLSLAYRILTNQPEVMRLVSPKKFKSGPKLIRAQLYLYSFTNLNDKGYSTSLSNDWWTRQRSKEYFPAFRADDAQLNQFLSQSGILLKERSGDDPGRIRHLWAMMKRIRALVELVPAPEFVWTLTASVLALFAGKRAIL